MNVHNNDDYAQGVPWVYLLGGVAAHQHRAQFTKNGDGDEGQASHVGEVGQQMVEQLGPDVARADLREEGRDEMPEKEACVE